MRVKRCYMIFILCLSCFMVSCQSISENSIKCTSHDTNKLVNNNIKIENIPFLIYQNTGEDEVATKLGNWNLKNCSIDMNKKIYISNDKVALKNFYFYKDFIVKKNYRIKNLFI